MTEQVDEGQTAAPEAPAVKGKAVKQDATLYLVLTLHGETWQNRGPYPARSAEQAVREYATAADITDPLTLVAVPARSFRPVTVKPKTTTTLVLEDA